MDVDFLVFQLKLLHSLSPHVPLVKNLRAVMAPAAERLRYDCNALAAMHVFVNPDLDQLHVMVVGSSEKTRKTLV